MIAPFASASGLAVGTPDNSTTDTFTNNTNTNPPLFNKIKRSRRSRNIRSSSLGERGGGFLYLFLLMVPRVVGNSLRLVSTTALTDNTIQKDILLGTRQSSTGRSASLSSRLCFCAPGDFSRVLAVVKRDHDTTITSFSRPAVRGGANSFAYNYQNHNHNHHWISRCNTTSKRSSSRVHSRLFATSPPSPQMNMYHLDSIGSTQDEARRILQDETLHGTLYC
mmetsp:Transcript_5578/g.10602  ORF Transcript_5578/g.10602 Transcript_5578/m.10602 type:complete len:222 (-) Transcript_5578:396-1061(-)